MWSSNKWTQQLAVNEESKEERQSSPDVLSDSSGSYDPARIRHRLVVEKRVKNNESSGNRVRRDNIGENDDGEEKEPEFYK